MKLKSTIIFSLSFLVFISGLFFMHSMSFASANIENSSVLIQTESPYNILLPHALGTYNYCPSAIKDNNSIYLFYCANQSPNIIKDHIYLSKITPLSNKKTLFTKKKLLLSPELSGWDSVHVCDPTVICGSFFYNKKDYSYLMAYTGCDSLDNQGNQIGFAVSNNFEGPFIKTNTINPFLTFEKDPEKSALFQWGVGQPSLISVNKQGLVLLFYTSGTANLTSEKMSYWDLSNLNSPIKISECTLSEKGLQQSNGNPDFISNADFVYDSYTKKMYMTSDIHPFPTGILSMVPGSSRISATSTPVLAHASETLAQTIWTNKSVLSPAVTGYIRNHNAGFLRDSYGNLTDLPMIFYTGAYETPDFSTSLWTYRIQGRYY